MLHFKEKKTYSKPDIERIAMDEDSLDRVTGGISDKGGKKKKDNAPTTFVDTDDLYSVTDSELNNEFASGGGDVGAGRGRGGGCDGVPYHRMARTFSSGRNSGC